MEVHGNVTINNLIEKQEITVESGGVLNFGTPQVENEDAASAASEGQGKPCAEASSAGVEGLAVEDEEMLLPVFKMDKENLRQFFAEVQGAAPAQIYNKINAWIGDGRMAKKFNVSKFHEVLEKMKIYTQSYQALNDNITK